MVYKIFMHSIVWLVCFSRTMTMTFLWFFETYIKSYSSPIFKPISLPKAALKKIYQPEKVYTKMYANAFRQKHQEHRFWTSLRIEYVEGETQTYLLDKIEGHLFFNNLKFSESKLQIDYIFTKYVEKRNSFFSWATDNTSLFQRLKLSNWIKS